MARGKSMSSYVEAPEIYCPDGRQSIFLAGGIMGQPNWQKELSQILLKATDLAVLNPRRQDFQIDNKKESRNQIRWEFEHFRKTNAICFWFPPATLCPITLFELGAWLSSNKVLFIGVDIDYKRRRDVEIQVELARPDLQVFHSLESLSTVIIEWANQDQSPPPVWLASCCGS